MKTLNVDELKAGMILAEPVLTKRGQSIANTGDTLTNQLIAKMTFYKIESASVEEVEEEEVVEEATEVVEEAPKKEKATKFSAPKKPSYVGEQITYSQKLKASPVFQRFQSDYAINIDFLRKTLHKIADGGDASCVDELLMKCEVLFKSKTSIELFDLLGYMRNVEDPIYSHSLNVALISRSIGKWLKYSREDLNTLTVCGLLHDIGKLQISDEILHKPDIYTDEEFEEMKNHPLLGKKLLNGKGFDARVLSATLQHHERSDGSGYPRGLDDDEIDDFAAIVAIADVYDAMTSARAHRDPLCSFQVIAEFEKEGLHKFRTKFVLTFLEHIANTYNNSRVMLNDAKTGRVVYINKSNLSRPVIQLDSGDIINLADSIYSDIYIKSIL
ncbi:MAG: HD-GYP domain-containing protein [Pseudobutyrivibrio sp.]|nr:HD-GYP domain-containing protein [Pseudobutyrivibrio sp.]